MRERGGRKRFTPRRYTRFLRTCTWACILCVSCIHPMKYYLKKARTNVSDKIKTPRAYDDACSILILISAKWRSIYVETPCEELRSGEPMSYAMNYSQMSRKCTRCKHEIRIIIFSLAANVFYFSGESLCNKFHKLNTDPGNKVRVSKDELKICDLTKTYCSIPASFAIFPIYIENVYAHSRLINEKRAKYGVQLSFRKRQSRH